MLGGAGPQDADSLAWAKRVLPGTAADVEADRMKRALGDRSEYSNFIPEDTDAADAVLQGVVESLVQSVFKLVDA
jgi:hypothetical protein